MYVVIWRTSKITSSVAIKLVFPQYALSAIYWCQFATTFQCRLYLIFNHIRPPYQDKRANFRPPALFVLADEVLHRINRLGNIAIFPDVDVQLVSNLAIDKAIHGDAEGRDVFQCDALETADAHAVVQVNCEAVFADVADEAVRGMVADIGHAKTLRHAGINASV